MIDTVIQVIRYILKDLLEPAAYLPYGAAAGGLFLLGWYLWRRMIVGEEKVCRPDRKQWLLVFGVVYITVLLKLAFFSREPGSRTGIDLIPFSTWKGGPQAHAYFDVPALWNFGSCQISAAKKSAVLCGYGISAELFSGTGPDADPKRVLSAGRYSH